MIKTDYETRALKFARILVALFSECYVLEDFVKAVARYNATHSVPLHYDNGVSRFVIMRADYVIKFDMTPTGFFKHGQAGNNTTEQAVYAKAVQDGFAHLLAKTTVVNMNNRVISIMPRVSHVHDERRYYANYLSYEEIYWLEDNVNDLHDGNIGYFHGKPVVIDYAWDPNR